MRIVIDYTPAVHQGAGIGRHTRGLISALAPLTAGHDVTLLVFGAPHGEPASAPPGLTVRTLPLPNRWLTVGWHRLRIPLPVELLSGATDLYHASDFVLPPLRQARGLLTVHDLSFVTAPECADAGLRAYLSRVVPRSAARADHILADSQSTRRDLIDLLGVAPEKVTVVYPGVEARFQPEHDPAALHRVRARYGLGDQPFILGVGTLEPRKNWPALILAWERLRKTGHLPHHLVIAGGKGWMVEEIFRVAQASPLAQDIHFTGFVADEDLPALYAAADLFAFPSRYEGFGIPVIEAMACGTPVVCADNSSLPEAAGEAALLVNCDDIEGLATAMGRLIGESALRARLRAAGLAQAARFTWDAAAAVLWQTYQQVCHAP